MERHPRRREVPYTEVEEGLVLYDGERRAAHSLSPVAGAVWRACDGHTSARALSAALGLEPAAVEAALAELRAAHLLDEPNRAETRTVSRRQALKRMGGVALAPAVISIALPAVASAQSGGCQSDGSPCLFDSDCCTFNCIGEGPSDPGVCRDAGCGQNGDPCNDNGECCTANPFCDSNQCAPCLSLGSAQGCGDDSACCAPGVCDNGPGGTQRCESCRSNDAICGIDGECCSNICDGGVCATCRDPGSPCSNAFECCGSPCSGGTCP